MLARIPDAATVNGWAWKFPYAYGGLAPLKFSGITYGGKIPVDDTGLTFELIVKETRDGPTILSVTSGFVIANEPLSIGYGLDTTLAGFEPGGTYLGELWVTDADAAYGRQLVNEFHVVLSGPNKTTFP